MQQDGSVRPHRPPMQQGDGGSLRDLPESQNKPPSVRALNIARMALSELAGKEIPPANSDGNGSPGYARATLSPDRRAVGLRAPAD